jgi:POT family proton-dependent oligopeptide transporter
MASQAPAANYDNEPTWLGHPRGLFVLFFAELWERFCFYGMRALLALYVVQQFHKPQADASVSYGAFTALVYVLGVFGGSIADKVLGYRRSIVLGGVLMAIGEFLLMVPTESMFLVGLAVMVVGNGLFKPNISTLVGKLYKQGDVRRDGGFTIFYMGINIGAFLAPIVCQWISMQMGSNGVPDYRYGFMAAGFGMLLARLGGTDSNGNAVVGRHLGLDTRNSIVRSDEDHLVVTLGVEDLIVVHTPTASARSLRRSCSRGWRCDSAARRPCCRLAGRCRGC